MLPFQLRLARLSFVRITLPRRKSHKKTLIFRGTFRLHKSFIHVMGISKHQGSIT
jgi:hypothetical protein